jgi:hypothetical protein
MSTPLMGACARKQIMSWRSASLSNLAERRENSGSSATVTGTVATVVMGDWVNLIKLNCNPLA